MVFSYITIAVILENPAFMIHQKQHVSAYQSEQGDILFSPSGKRKWLQYKVYGDLFAAETVHESKLQPLQCERSSYISPWKDERGGRQIILDNRWGLEWQALLAVHIHQSPRDLLYFTVSGTLWSFRALKNLYLLYPIFFSQVPFSQVEEHHYFLFTDEKNWQAKRLSDWLLMVHLTGLKPRVQNVKLVKTIYLAQCFPLCHIVWRNSEEIH